MPRVRLFVQVVLVSAVAAALSTGAGAAGFAPLDSAQVMFGRGRYDEAQQLFEQAVADSPRHALARCGLAETRRRLERPADAVREARAALAIDPQTSCAHAVLADCYDPVTSAWDGANADSAWAHFCAAAASDRRNAQAWLGVWKYAIARGDSARERESLDALSDLGWFTSAVVAYNRWQLEFLPRNAVLLTRGDNDTPPSAMLQAAAGTRADVAVVSLALLEWPAYATAIGRRAGLPLPAGIDTVRKRAAGAGGTPGVADRVVSAWADSVKRGTLPRPLVVAAGAARIGEMPALRGRLTFAGPYFSVAPDTGAASDDLPQLAKTVAAIDASAFTGPWSSEPDPHSIRIAGSVGLGANLLNAALRWGKASLDAGDKASATAALAKLDSLTAVLGGGEVMRGKIRRLRAAATQH
jgi:tetratricopeptide (TPR) repeat protein